MSAAHLVVRRAATAWERNDDTAKQLTTRIYIAVASKVKTH